MRRIIFAGMSTVSGLVLLFSYHTSTNRPSATEAISAPVETAGTLTAGTHTGASVNTDYGNVQVRITVKKGKITKSTAITYPKSSARSISLSEKAVPTLNAEAVEVQSAEVDLVTGATSTSTGYAKSLQSALDKAFA